MKIAYLSIGGHIHTERWLGYFVEKGHDVHLMTVQPAPIDGVKVYDIRTGIPWKPLHYAVALRKVKRILADVAPDVLHTHFLTGYGYWGAFSGFHPFIMTVWGDDVYLTPHQSLLKGQLARHVLRKADLVTGDSRDILDHAIEMGADPSLCHVILWGVDTDRFKPGVGGDVRERLGIPASAPVVISVRSFTQPYYNIDVILETVSAVQERSPQAHFVFAGNEGDDAEFRRMAQRLGLDERTHFVGKIPHERFHEYLAASDVFVSVPSVDATAVSLLEAMACGTSVVVSSLASSLEWVEDGVTGLSVPPRDADALTEAVVRLIGSPDLRRELGSEAVKTIRERADHRSHMARMEQIMIELVERWRRDG
jgi:glycosyltransferase involved in cell wall biosynthesis